MRITKDRSTGRSKGYAFVVRYLPTPVIHPSLQQVLCAGSLHMVILTVGDWIDFAGLCVHRGSYGNDGV